MWQHLSQTFWEGGDCELGRDCDKSSLTSKLPDDFIHTIMSVQMRRSKISVNWEWYLPTGRSCDDTHLGERVACTDTESLERLDRAMSWDFNNREVSSDINNRGVVKIKNITKIASSMPLVCADGTGVNVKLKFILKFYRRGCIHPNPSPNLHL